TDFNAMLDHPGLEAIVVSTGADSHAPFAIAAMKKGYHVFVEKPLCTSVAEALELRKVAKETGRVFGMGHNDHSKSSMFLLAKQYMEEGKLGVVTAVEENTSHSGGLEIKPGDWRGLADKNPGGMLFQCGCHALHGLRFLFGDVTDVMAMMRYDANPNTQTADAANVLLRYKSGLVGTLNSYHTTAYCHELRIFGTKGNLYFDTQTNRGWFQPRYRGPVEPREELTIPPAPPHALEGNVLSWYDGIRKGTPVYPSLEDGIAAIQVVFAAEESAKTGKMVAI
ncbi:MAG: Gfo/Idh/MocA family oxidoreductase, partial [Kiritimatiellaeota bacterium]|nr:Gfo/Idh/MocA family oxidoreductase [Kiritimatiellota bacterium]